MTEVQTIKINVEGNELESILIELSEEEVRGLYQLRKSQSAKIAELEKKLKETESLKAHYNSNLEIANSELSHANTLLTALGVQEKTNEEEAYYRKALPIVTRIALYIANLSKK